MQVMLPKGLALLWSYGFSMEVLVNQQPVILSDNSNVLSLLDHLNKKQEGIAVAVGERIIPRSEWASTSLKDKDQIILITATQGG